VIKIEGVVRDPFCQRKRHADRGASASTVLRRDRDVTPVKHLEQLGQYESWQIWHVGRHHNQLVGLTTQLVRQRRHRDVSRNVQCSGPQQLGDRGWTGDTRPDADQIGQHLVAIKQARSGESLWINASWRCL